MTVRGWSQISRLALTGAVALAVVGGCQDRPIAGPEPEPVDSLPTLTHLVISDPASVSVSNALTLAGPGRVYASLPPGSIPGGVQITFTNRRTHTEAQAQLRDGGLDPLPVEADSGDTLHIVIELIGGAEQHLAALVPARRRPVVVRTTPPPGRRDVPLNSIMLVVFSEPVSPAALSASSVQLSVSGAPVSGTLAFGDSAHLSVTFVPAAELTADTEYTLLLTPVIEDLDGQTLEAPVAVNFRTETATSPPSTAEQYGLILSNASAAGIVYASIPFGRHWGDQVTFTNRRTGAQATTPLVNAGFDPFAIAAEAGDTLSVLVNYSSGWLTFRVVVPARRSPIIVRTDPPDGRRDLQNPQVLVVFSEPLMGAVLEDSLMRLSVSGTPLGGTLAFADSAHVSVTFTPAAPLTPGARHTLTMTRAIRDRDGDALDSVSMTLGSLGPGMAPGRQLAFVRSGQIYRANSDGTGLVRLTDGPRDWYPAWSPDGSRIAFVREQGNARDLYIMNADGSNPVLRVAGLSTYDAPSWAPDNQRMVFTGISQGSQNIFVVNTNDSNPAVPIVSLPGWDGQPAWSPDGARIAIVSDWNYYDFAADVFTVAPDGTQQVQLTNNSGPPAFWLQYYHPTWSPNGQRLAVTTCEAAYWSCSAGMISVMNADGSGLMRLVSGAGRLAWTSDGQVIAFGTGNGIYWVSADGSSSGLIIADGHSPSWRP